MTRLFALAGLLLACGCPAGDAPDDAATPLDAGAETGALAACLDRPTELPRPPGATLPCELIPPGVILGR